MFEDPRIIAAAIAFAGVLISVTSSFFISRLVASGERQNIKQQLHNTYSEKIVSERIRSYPELYNLVSTFLKQVYDGSFKETGRISDLKEAVRKWDGENAIFMSSQTQHDMYSFRAALDDFSVAFDEVTGEYEMADLNYFWQTMTRLELSLKADIGVFVLDEYDGKTTFSDYGSLMDHMKVQ